MARESLIVVFGMVAASCLVADPPEYKAPEQTPPFLSLREADPPVGQILRVNSGSIVPFNIPVRSEDAGDDLLATLYLDYGLVGQDPQAFAEERAATFDDTQRSISFSWTVRAVSGCHQLTLVVCHEENYSFPLQRCDPELSLGDTAIATWWANVNYDEADPYTLRDCPRPASTELEP